QAAGAAKEREGGGLLERIIDREGGSGVQSVTVEDINGDCRGGERPGAAGNADNERVEDLRGGDTSGQGSEEEGQGDSQSRNGVGSGSHVRRVDAPGQIVPAVGAASL